MDNNIDRSFQLAKSLMASYVIAMEQEINEGDLDNIRSIVQDAVDRFKLVSKNIELIVTLECGSKIKGICYFKSGDFMVKETRGPLRGFPLNSITSVLGFDNPILNLYRLKLPVKKAVNPASYLVAAESSDSAIDLYLSSELTPNCYVYMPTEIESELLGVAASTLERGVIIRSAT